MATFSLKDRFSFFVLLFLILLLPLTIFLVQQRQRYTGRATYVAPHLVVETAKSEGILSYPWRGLAQGGEVAKNGIPVSFADIKPQIFQLKPRFIRIDHIYDLYTVVSISPQGKLSVDFSLLDKTVDDILETGATPFLSLSYMPSSIAVNGDVIGLPKDWALWQELVFQTVDHFSGVKERNLQNVYYEVWNEPDLFGKWTIGGDKDYQLLYRYAVLGATQATEVNPFFIGGPAVTHPMEKWFTQFLSYIQNENLRIDFLSWHRYTFWPSDILSDLELVNFWLLANPAFASLPKFITEWASDSGTNEVHDSSLGAYYTLSTATYVANKVEGIFSFEIKDGPSPLGEQYWGRWGLFTNEAFGLVAKPRFQALDFLNSLAGEKLQVSGEGTYVSGLATKNNNQYQLLLVNYHPPSSYSPSEIETVPVAFKDLPRGVYSYQTTEVFKEKTIVSLEEISGDTFEKIMQMPKNTAFLITLSKEGELATYEEGRFGKDDKALVFDTNLSQLSFPTTLLSTNSGTIEFWWKLAMPASSFQQETFFSIPLSSSKQFTARKQLSPTGFGTIISFGFFENGQPTRTANGAVSSWQTDQWHHLNFSWDTTLGSQSFLRLYLDGKLVSEALGISSFSSEGDTFTVGGFSGAIDELRISSIARDPSSYFTSSLSSDSATLLLRHFNGRVEE